MAWAPFSHRHTEVFGSAHRSELGAAELEEAARRLALGVHLQVAQAAPQVDDALSPQGPNAGL